MRSACDVMPSFGHGNEASGSLEHHAAADAHTVAVDLDGPGHQPGDGAHDVHAARGIALDQLERRLYAVAGDKHNAHCLEIRPVLEAEPICTALPGPEEVGQGREIRAPLDAAANVPAPAGLLPIGVPAPEARHGGDNGGVIARAPGGAARDRLRKPDVVKSAHLSSLVLYRVAPRD